MENIESTVTAPRRKVFREEIVNAIRNAIFSEELKPGDRIIETFWARELGVSQGPVREAIRDLEGIGLVETIPFKGSRVRALTEKDLQDNYSVRMCLETKSVWDVILNLSDEELDALVEELRTALAEMDDCAERGDLREFTLSDARFHRLMMEANGNQVLIKLWEQCNIRNWFMFSKVRDVDSLKQLQSEHGRLLEKIRARDLEGAVATMETHLIGLMDNITNGMTFESSKRDESSLH